MKRVAALFSDAAAFLKSLSKARRTSPGGAAAQASNADAAFWTLRKALLVLGLAVTLCIATAEIWITAQFQNFALDTLHDVSGSTLKSLVDDRVGREYVGKLRQVADKWSRGGPINAAVHGKKADDAKQALTTIWLEAESQLGKDRLVNLLAFDSGYNLIGATGSDSDTVTQSAALLKRLKARDKAAQRRILDLTWVNGKSRPLLSLVVPIGAFSIAGYLEIVVDPLVALKGLGPRLGGDLRVLDLGGRELLSESAEADASASPGARSAAPRSADLDTVAVTLPDSAGRPWMKLEFSRDVSGFTARIAKLRILIVEIMLGCAVLAWLLGWLALRNTVFGTLKRFAKAMGDISEGRTDIAIPRTGRDELKTMAEALSALRSSVTERARMAEEIHRQKQETEARAAKVDALVRDFDREMSNALAVVDATVDDVTGTAQSMLAAVEDVTARTRSVVQSSEQASANVQTVAAAAEEMSSSVQSIQSQVTRSTAISQNTVGEAQRMQTSIDRLAQAAQHIGEIVTVISSIARQTNLLALNATIEAARAGEAGRGFAVVANEVKALATQTAKATDEVSREIAEIQNATREAVGATEGVNSRIAEIDAVITVIAGAVEQQSAVTVEIARSAQSAAVGTDDVSSTINDIRDKAETTGDASRRAGEAATNLTTQASIIAKAINAFLADIRAA
jgi:methyl-accepting chemotaxis protein